MPRTSRTRRRTTHSKAASRSEQATSMRCEEGRELYTPILTTTPPSEPYNIAGSAAKPPGTRSSEAGRRGKTMATGIDGGWSTRSATFQLSATPSHHSGETSASPPLHVATSPTSARSSNKPVGSLRSDSGSAPCQATFHNCPSHHMRTGFHRDTLASPSNQSCNSTGLPSMLNIIPLTFQVPSPDHGLAHTTTNSSSGTPPPPPAPICTTDCRWVHGCVPLLSILHGSAPEVSTMAIQTSPAKRHTTAQRPASTCAASSSPLCSGNAQKSSLLYTSMTRVVADLQLRSHPCR
mmetsp:Transcript_37889/g.108957  ORF Transcript_37889/g.108957 Transcript_37889/m.108957 type:complete len:293 (+) Transcript_37889:577-1455(+)